MSVPAVYQGNVIEPAHISQAHSFPARDFFNVIRDVVHKSLYHNENDRLAALSAIDGYEKHVIPAADQAYVVGESDRAPVEDVTLRKPATAPLAAAGQAIDYARLAAAIVAAQAAQASAAGDQVVHTVTDVQPT